MSIRVCFVVDSGTDVRLVESLGRLTSMRILARAVPNGRVISQDPRIPVDLEVGPASHAAFCTLIARRLWVMRNEIDVVLVQGYGPSAAVANMLGRLTGKPALMLVCSPAEAYYRCRRTAGGRRFSVVEYAAIKLLAVLNAWIGFGYIVLSPYLASVVRAHGSRIPVDVIPVYGVDRSVFFPGTEPKSSLRRRLGLPEDQSIIFFSSRVAPEKDAEAVLRAVGRLATSGRCVKLLHLSGGHRELFRVAESIGVQSHVIAGDAVAPFEQLADYYRASDVCVQASREEGLGFSPLEGLACGVPVVATAVGGLNDTIRDGETGWQVPVGDDLKLARALAEILDDPAEAARRCANAIMEIDRSYERGRVFEALLARLMREIEVPLVSSAAIERERGTGSI